ncbi:glycosyltransferase, partial [Paenibacillus polymyxa]|uniref:glycosyltransferase n=1 Tax=Paenibacillus polymyxa TaxID=1406 RepID=UPI001FEDBF30
MKKIIFTGGGSSGHVAVNLALIPHLLEQHWSVQYIGSEQGIERKLISGLEDV